MLADHGIAVASIYGIFSADNDVSSNRPHRRQAALDYLKREVLFAAEIGAGYLLVVPGAVGHPGVCHINCDVYHMQAEEEHIGEAILADSNRRALGRGSLDLDTII